MNVNTCSGMCAFCRLDCRSMGNDGCCRGIFNPFPNEHCNIQRRDDVSTVSYIPGRLRIESRELIINHSRWGEISRRIKRIQGVASADVNCRTGRLLIMFDEAAINNDLLLKRVAEIIGTPEEAENCEPARLTNRNSAVTNRKRLFSRIAMDIAGHALLPGPLGLLLPFAVTALRKDAA